MPIARFQLPDGRVARFEVPQGTTPEQAQTLMEAHFNEAPPEPQATGVDAIPGQTEAGRTSATVPQEDSWLNRLRGVTETGLAMATGVPAALVGQVAGLGQGLFGGKYGTPEGVTQAAQTAANVSNYLTYQPRTEAGQQYTGELGKMFNAVGPAVGALPEMNMLGQAMAPVTQMGKDTLATGQQVGQQGLLAAQQAGTNALARVMPKKPVMPGIGAAETQAALLRQSRASGLDVPINLTKGEATRNFEQQRFEKETAKMPGGEALRTNAASNNEKLLRNFNSFHTATGAEKVGRRALGEVVDDVVVYKFKKVQQEVGKAFDEARTAGEMAEPVPYAPLNDFLKKNSSVETNAPVLSAIRKEIKRLDPQGSGMISLNDLEQIRQMTGKLATPGTPNLPYGIQAKKVIDVMTEGKGGPLYQQARSLNTKFKNEFENVGVIDKLLSTKPGTKDRAVAFEDVYNHAVVQSSRDDLHAVRNTLQTAGPKGQQAWREIQGAAINDAIEQITKNTARDVNGNPILSPAAFNKWVKTLEQDGKLEVLFGKKGAEKIHDLNEVSLNLTAVPGAVNSSNTASVLAGLLEASAMGAITGLPVPLVSLAKAGVKKYKANALAKQVQGAINYNALAPAP